MNTSILIIDDEKPQREALSGYFKKKGYTVFQAESGLTGLEIAKANLIDIVLTDYKMPDITGLETLEGLKKINPDIAVIVMTAYGNIEIAVEAMKAGALNYLQKPVNLDELDILIARALLHKQMITENKKLKEELDNKYNFENIVYQSKSIEEALNIAVRVAKSNAPVLLRGESGTGKELFAKAIHFSSDRKDEPFVTVNCAAFPETLLESEMFGYEKGSFTGADQKRIGRFEEAKDGTIFIDEIGDIPLTMQVKLLRVLQSGEFSRLGSNQLIKTNARIITATNRDLEDLIKKNLFREDFYYRINVVSINIPTLRERKEDIPLLAEYFMKKFGCSDKSFSKEAYDMLMKYNYPGNIRELENIIQRACVLSRDIVITSNDLPVQIWQLTAETNIEGFMPEISDLNNQLAQFEKEIITKALKETNGNQSKAAKLLNISERNLRYKMSKYNM
jgi:two-component system NtrC family response regulator